MGVFTGRIRDLSLITDTEVYELDLGNDATMHKEISSLQGKRVHIYGALMTCELELGGETLTLKIISVKNVKPIF